MFRFEGDICKCKFAPVRLCPGLHPSKQARPSAEGSPSHMNVSVLRTNAMKHLPNYFRKVGADITECRSRGGCNRGALLRHV